MTPYEAHYGRPPVLVADIIMNNTLEPGTRLADISDYVKLLKIKAAYIHGVIRESGGSTSATQGPSTFEPAR